MCWPQTRKGMLKVITINSAKRFDLSLECMRLGAYDDYLIPFDLDALMVSLRKALDAQHSGQTDKGKSTKGQSANSIKPRR